MEKERDVEYVCFTLILKGMTGAPLSYLVTKIINQFSLIICWPDDIKLYST
jgi:hypothetical protein